MTQLSRRELVRIVGLGSVGLAACNSRRPRAGALGVMERWNELVRRALFSPDRELAPGQPTPPDAFPVYHIADRVPIAPAGWLLKVGGRVARSRSFSLAELMQLPRTETRIEHHCVEGWSAVAEWAGVRVRDLAAAVGADRVDYVEFRSFDAGYWSSWDRESAFHPQTLLAYAMNGRPLGPDHGAPVRLYGAVKLGYKNVKYLTEVNFLDHETGGYWEDRGYEWYAGT